MEPNDLPSPADQAKTISGGPNPYPVGDAEGALADADAEELIDDTGSPLVRPLDVEPPKR
ncbi:MAG: hypothetical protein JST54_35255 [Deltaproteobacteria bacterium]|nr:hypothetical protein [Deltaproteobacteria bacterium]